MHLPDEEFIRLLNLNWSGEAANFRDSAGQLATTDPSAFESGPAALLLRQDLVEEMAESKGFSICWTVVGEKLAYLPGPMQRTGQIHISGACALRNGRIEGFVHVIKDSPRQELSEGILTTKRF